MIKDKKLVAKIEQIEECKRVLQAFGGKQIVLKDKYLVPNEVLLETLNKLYLLGYSIEVIARAVGLTMATVIKALEIDVRHGSRSKASFYGKYINNKDFEAYIDTYHKKLVCIQKETSRTARGTILIEYILESKYEHLIYVVSAEYEENKEVTDNLLNLKMDYYYCSKCRLIQEGKINVVTLLGLYHVILPFILMLIYENYKGKTEELFDELGIIAAEQLSNRNQICFYNNLNLCHDILVVGTIWTQAQEEYDKAVKEGRTKGVPAFMLRAEGSIVEEIE